MGSPLRRAQGGAAGDVLLRRPFAHALRGRRPQSRGTVADGQYEEGDLLVGADGLQSTVRAQLLPDLAPRYAGYVGWRGVAEDDGALDPLAFDHMLVGFPPGELALAIPAPPAAARGSPRRCHFTWFRPAAAAGALPRLMTDASGRQHAISIPPPLIRPELIDAMKADAARLLAPQIAGVVTRTARPLLQPIVDLESPRLAFGRAILLGDAAFVARPHVGTGVTKAALDAQGLADALQAHGDDIDAALAHYDAERHAFGAALVARGRYLGGWIEAQSDAASEPAEAWRDRRAEDFIRAFGSAGVASPSLSG